MNNKEKTYTLQLTAWEIDALRSYIKQPIFYPQDCEITDRIAQLDNKIEIAWEQACKHRCKACTLKQLHHIDRFGFRWYSCPHVPACHEEDYICEHFTPKNEQ